MSGQDIVKEKEDEDLQDVLYHISDVYKVLNNIPLTRAATTAGKTPREQQLVYAIKRILKELLELQVFDVDYMLDMKSKEEKE